MSYIQSSIESFSIEDLGPNDLIMDTPDWQKQGLPSMGTYSANITMYGADLSVNVQATNAKASFHQYASRSPQQVIDGCCHVNANIVVENFQTEN